MSRHYYFKQDEGNKGLRGLIQAAAPLVKGNTYKLGIFYQDEITVDLSDEALAKIKWARSIYKTQVKMFRDLEIGDYIWLFDSKIYVFQVKSKNVELIQSKEGKYRYLYQEKCKCKAKDFEFIHEFEPGAVPLFFSCCNSNQAFNRNTISEFSNIPGSDRVLYFDVANVLLGLGKKIEISLDNFGDYLSPKQFEAFLSLLFLYHGKIPDSLLGGSRKDVDLCVYDNVNRDREIRYQIKKSKNNFKFEDEDLHLIYLGDVEDEKKHGRKWIKEQLLKTRGMNTGLLPSLEDWLKCQFPINVFTIKF